MIVLLDTSVWIEFFQRKPLVDADEIERLVEERRVVTCRPVVAELLSGRMSSQTRLMVSRAMEAFTLVDPDWNAPDVWKRLVDLAALAHRKKGRTPGLVDRMILLCTHASGAALWTLDRRLQNLARQTDVTIL